MPAPSNVEHIEITDQMGRQPKLKGRRITVAMIATWHLQHGLSVEEIAADHCLSLSEVHAALAYFFDHREDIERQRREIDRSVEDLRQQHPSVLTEKLKRPASG